MATDRLVLHSGPTDSVPRTAPAFASSTANRVRNAAATAESAGEPHRPAHTLCSLLTHRGPAFASSRRPLLHSLASAASTSRALLPFQWRHPPALLPALAPSRRASHLSSPIPTSGSIVLCHSLPQHSFVTFHRCVRLTRVAPIRGRLPLLLPLPASSSLSVPTSTPITPARDIDPPEQRPP